MTENEMVGRVDVLWGLPRCVWARESTAPAQGYQSVSRELRAWEALGEARPGQSSLSAGALRYRAWA